MTAKYEVDGLNLDREQITGCRLEEREMDILCSSVKRERERKWPKKNKSGKEVSALHLYLPPKDSVKISNEIVKILRLFDANTSWVILHFLWF